MEMVLLTALGVGGATVIGAIIGFIFKKISHRFSDIVLAFAAGVMLAAAVLGLVIPSIEYGGKYGIIITVVGIFVGALCLNLVDKLVPHLHKLVGPDIEEHGATKLSKVLLFVTAIAIHNLPEGIAAGVGSACADLLLGYAYYAPATFIIKLLDAFIAGAIFRLLGKKQRTPSVTLSVAGLFGSVIMVLGYFLYSFLFLGDGFSAAFSAIPANILQAVTGIALSDLLYELLCSHKAIKRFFDI